MQILSLISAVALTFVAAGCHRVSSEDISVAALGATTESKASALTVNHLNYRDCESASLAQMKKVGSMKLFFSHASVGENILDGLRSLSSSDPKRYQFKIQKAGDSPEGATTPGTIYERDRGNPGASSKVKLFSGYIDNGWKKPKVDVSLNKFCFIDQDADLDEYLQSMASLEAANADTVLPYATMPLRIEGDAKNVKREAFNGRLREWTSRHGKPLLDIADIEAYDPNGTVSSYENYGHRFRKLYQGFSKDGGHLNAAGSQALAKGIYTLMLKISSSRG